MKKATKLVLVVLAALLFIALSVVIYTKANESLMSKTEAKNFVTERYEGDIKKMSLSKDKKIFHVNIKDDNKMYSLDIDRKEEVIKNVQSKTVESNKTTTNNKNKQNKEKNTKKEESKKPLISENEAKQIAHKKVGGEFVNIKKNTNATPNTYIITHHVDDDEGAVISVNAVNGKINSVSWFNIEQPQSEQIDPQPKVQPETQPNENYYYEQDDDDDYDDDYDDD